ncbi:MAG: 5-formyltetrahydrofolate cyclo-ligase [Roseinatronobacter sp.]
MDKRAARIQAAAQRAETHDPSGAQARAASSHVSAYLAVSFGPDLPNLTLAGYLAIGTEIDPIHAMRTHPGPVCVPVVQGKGQPLVFHLWTPQTVLKDGVFGVPVPRDAVPMIPDIVLVPGLAFDRNGYRLGYGGGFYDRTLAQCRPRLALGLAYCAQVVDALPTGPHDIALDALATPDGIRACCAKVGTDFAHKNIRKQ